MLKDEGFVTEQGKSCLMGCIRNYLLVLNYDIWESDIAFAIQNGNVYFKFDKAKNRYSLETNFDKNTITFLKKYNVGSVYRTRYRFVRAKQKIEKLVSNNAKLSICVCNAALDYNSVFRRTQSTKHWISVIGMEDSRAIISDAFTPLDPPKCFQGESDLDKLVEGWVQAGGYYCVCQTDQNNTKLPSLKENFLSNFKVFLMNYMEGGNKKRIWYGNDGVHKMSEYIKDIPTIEKDNWKAILVELNFQIKASGFFTVKMLIVEAIERLMEEFKIEGLENLYDTSLTVRKAWSNVSMLIVKVSISGKEELLNKIYSKIKNIIDIEMQLYQELIVKIDKEEFKS